MQVNNNPQFDISEVALIQEALTALYTLTKKDNKGKRLQIALLQSKIAGKEA